MKIFYALIFIVFSLSAGAQVYFHDFGTTVISAHPYTVNPVISNPQITGSSWTNSTTGWTSFAGFTGEAIALSNSGGTPFITLSFNVNPGYKLNISSFNFWRERSNTGAQNWAMYINGITCGSGTVPISGGFIGNTTVANPVNNLSGTVSIVFTLTGASGSGTFRLDDFTLYGSVVPNEYVLLDHFNRNDTIRPAIPSSGGPAWWVEQESGVCFTGSVLQKIRIKNNMLELAACNYNNSVCLASQTQATGMNMTGKYPTVFSSAAGTMEWYFNMQQTRTDPTGFGSGEYGAAFVIGSTSNDPLASNKSGYAVVFGEAGTTDPLRLVSFNGFAFNSTTFTNILSVPSPAVKTAHMSIKVTFNPCNSEWSLTVRDDGASFADPSTVTGVGATAINTTFTSTDLLWLGQVWNHGSACSLAKFDNIYIPKVGAATGTYTWNGTINNDFQLANNWTPKRQCIKVTDKLVFNSTSPASVILLNIPSQAIAQLTVTNNRSVVMKDVPGNAAVSTLTIGGAAGTDLQVDAGSTLSFDVETAAAGDGMVMNLSAGATGLVTGTINFQSTPGGTPSHRLEATDALAISVNSGGNIRALALSGNPFGSSGTQNTVVFNSGAVYECYSGGNPFGLAQPGSKVQFNSGSIYRHYTTNQPSVLGRIYADFENYSSHDINSGGAGAFTVNHFKIISGTVQVTGSLNSLPVNTEIKGDLTVLPGAGLIYNTDVASTISFSGSAAAQKINSTGTLELGRDVTVRLNSSYATAPQLTVETGISIAGVLDLVQGTIRLSADITLLSDSFSTASVAPVTGTIDYGAGRFVVERYIPGHAKAWQFLAVPATGQTVNQAWQEGNAPMVAGTAGYGTIITSNVAGSGFDAIGGSGPSMKTYDTSGAGSWKGITRTDTALYNKKGYMLFVRGDRTVTTISAPATATRLRCKGMIFHPLSNIPPVTSVGAGKFESIGNPYASAIDFSNELGVIKSANIQRVFYVWDPKLGSGYGGYQTFVKGAGTDYTVLPGGGSYPPAGSVYNRIQSGQAFFVRSFSGSGTVQFAEQAKVTGSDLVTRQSNGTGYTGKKLVTSLYAINGSNRILLDAVMNEFDEAYANETDELDMLKISNTGETAGLLVRNQVLSVERRKSLQWNDSVPYWLENMKRQDYEFEFNALNIFRPGMKAYLVDRFLQQKTPVNLSGITKIRFTVNDIPGSAASDRFLLVFKKAGTRNLQIDLPGEISVFPNPVSDNSLRISFNSFPAGNYTIRIADAFAHIILEQTVSVSGNRFSALLRLRNLVPGVYNLIVTDAMGNETARKQVIKTSTP